MQLQAWCLDVWLGEDGVQLMFGRVNQICRFVSYGEKREKLQSDELTVKVGSGGAKQIVVLKVVCERERWEGEKWRVKDGERGRRINEQ